jgi:GT2 family glycosyltransferase
MKINIYSPTYFRENKTKKAVESIIKTVNESKHDARYFLCDNNSNDTLKDWLLEKDSENERVETILSPVNYGKAKIVNQVHKTARVCDYVVSIDSDMLNVHSEYNWIDEMLDVLVSCPQVGVLSTFQEGSNCHLLHALNHRHEVKTPTKKHIVLHGSYGGVAGGCIMMRRNEFDSFGGYTVKDVYNADDALVMRKCNELLRKVTGVSETIGLYHMENEENEKDYQKWKIAKCKGEIKNGEDTKGFFDK